MPCLFALFAATFPRFGTLFIWLARPNQFMNSFNDKWWWAILGIIFLPFTTLMFVILTWGAGGLYGWDWFWIVMAVVIDLMHYSSTAYYNRERIPGYTAPSQPVV
jgi:hypothetical protein